MKKILALEVLGQYDVLQFFLKDICVGFEKEGYIIQKISYNEDFGINDLLNIPFHEFEFLFCFNSAYYETLAPHLPTTLPVIAFMVDHPIYHDERMSKNNCLNYIALHINKNNSDFANRYYPFINKNIFVPHGGSKPTTIVPYIERKYDVVFFGGYNDCGEIMAEINNKRGPYKQFSLEVIGTHFIEEIISIEMAIQKVCQKHGWELSKNELFSLVNDFIPEERFIRAYARDIAVRTLLDNGQDVHVFGNGWEKFRNNGSGVLHVHKPVEYATALDIMGNSKILLNATPAHNNGSHERIFSAMLSGAICFTDTNQFLIDTGLDQEVIMYSLKEIEDLPKMVQLILDNPEKSTLIAEHAKQVALENYSWDSVAKQVISIVEEYRAERNYKPIVYKNECDMQFNEWIRYVKNHSQKELFEKMKACLLSHKDDQSGYLQNALASYNRYGYWGKCYPERGIYDLIDNRVKEIKEHCEDLIWMFNHLEDYRSKKTLYNILRYWLDYSPIHLQKNLNSMDSSYFDLDIVECDENEVFVDLGGYHGDSSLQYINNFGKYKKIYCYEAFDKNLKLCKKNLCAFPNIDFRGYAVGNKNELVNLNISDNSSANQITEQGNQIVKMVSLDEDIKESVTFIKMDIEGSEYDAILGAKEHLKKEHPKLAIACYHNNQDIWRLAKTIHSINSGYHFYLRYYGGTLYPSEYVLYGI